jgi:hypothetical protein
LQVIDVQQHGEQCVTNAPLREFEIFKNLKWNVKKKKRSEWRGGDALGLQGIGGDGLGKDEFAVVLVLAVDSGTEKHTTALGFL